MTFPPNHIWLDTPQVNSPLEDAVVTNCLFLCGPAV